MADKKISALTAATTPLAGTEVLPIVQSGSTVKVANNDLRPKQIQSNATSGVLQIVGPAAAATRVMTTPDANFTAARTDAAQTFTGTQTYSDVVNVGNATNTYTGRFITKSDGTGGYAFATDNTVYQYLSAISGGVSIVGTATNHSYAVAVNGSTVWTFDTNKNLVQGTAAKGINFTANTPAAGMTSQLLNWYEEGTWTMAFSVASGSIPVKAGFTTGYYTRVGRLVTVTGVIVADPVTTPSGLLKITGLPFTSANNVAAASGVAIYGQGFTGTVNSLEAYIPKNTTEIIIKNLSAGAISDIGAYMTEYSQFIISATYVV